MGKNRVESALKKFLKRKIKITTAFVVSFLVTGTMGYSEIIDKTVEIKLENGQITITPNPEGTLEGNTWTHNGIIDAQNGNGISISQDITEDKNFSIINNGIIKGNKNGNDNFSGNGIYNDKSIISSLTNNGVISGKNTGEISEDVNALGNGIYNHGGTIGTITNKGVILGNTNIDISKVIMNIISLGNGICNVSGTIGSITNTGVISGEIETSGSISGSGNGIYNNTNNDTNKIGTLTNNGMILGKNENTGAISGNGNGNSSGNGVCNLGTIETITNSGVISGNGNGNYSGNGIYNSNYGTIKTITNSGVILGNGNGNSSGNGIYNSNYKTTITSLTNNGIIAGSNKAILDNGTIKNQENYGLLIDRAGTDNITISAGKGGEVDGENNSKKFVINIIDEITNKNIDSPEKISELKKGITLERIKKLTENSDYRISDNSFKNLVLNGYGTALEVSGELSLESSIVNGGVDGASSTIAGSEKEDILNLTGTSIINGNIDLGKGADTLNIDSTVQLNGTLNGGTGDFKDTLNFGSTTSTVSKESPKNNNINIFHEISNFENININDNVTLFETAKITGADKIYIGDGGQLTLRVDASQKDNNKIIGHGLYGENGDSTTISSTVKGTLNIDFIGGQNENIISFGNNKLENIMVDFTNPLFSTDGGGKNPTNEIQVFVNKNLDGVIGTPDGLKKDIDISLYDKLNKIYKSMYSIDGLLGTEFAGLTDDTTGEFLKYLHDIYVGNPYAYSSELSRKTMGMMRNLADRDLHPEINKWAIYGGLSHVDGGTKESFCGRNYYGYDIGSRDIKADTKITGGYFKAEYGKSESLTTGIIFGGNNTESEIGSSKVEGDSFYFGGYAKKFINDFRFTLGAGFQHGDYKADRTAVGYEGITETRKFDRNYHDRGFDIYGDIKYSKEIGNGLFFEPSFTLSYTYLDENGASEKGTLGIETDSKTFDYLSSEINLDVRKTFMTDKLTHSFVAGISYERLLNGYDEEYITGRIIGGTDFDILVPEKEKDNFFVNARYELETEKGMLFDIKCSYRFEHDNNQDEWTVGAGMGYKF